MTALRADSYPEAMRRLLAVSLAAAALAACAGPSVQEKREVAGLEAQRDYRAAAEKIRAEKAQYGPANLVLYDLDLAQADADAGWRPEADKLFAQAQDRMDQLWTLSVTKRAGALLANENVDDYRGEDFERALSHVLRGLNLLAMGKERDALIELERAEDFLQQLHDAVPRKRTYKDDAFAHWLAAQLYADLGMKDDARVSREAAGHGYLLYEQAYKTQPPAPPAGQGDAEVVFLHLDGPAPRKVRRQGGGPLGLLLNTSYPVYEPTPSRIVRSIVSVGTTSVDALPAEDVDAIAQKDLEERLLAYRARSTLRAAVKLAGTVTGVNAVDSEFADVRGWGTMPARIGVARLRVPAGRQEVVARYLDAQGREMAVRRFTVDARPGRRAWVVDRTAL